MNKKKLLALLMALVMTLSLVPVTAFAEEVLPAVTVTDYNANGYKGYVFTPGTSEYDSTYDSYYCNLVISFEEAISANEVTLFSFGQSGAMTPVKINADFDANAEIKILGDVLDRIKVNNEWTAVTSDGAPYPVLAAALSTGFPCGVVSYPASLEGANVTVKMVISDGSETLELARVEFTLSADAAIGNTYYATLAGAVTAANSSGNCTIKVLNDIDFSQDEYAGYKWADSTYNPIEITGDDVVLDLNNHKFYNMGNCALVFGHILAADGRIANGTIQNGTLEAGQTNNVTNSYVLGIAGVNGMTIQNITTNGGINVFTGSKNVVIDSCNVTGTKYYTVCAQTGSDVTIRGTMYIKNTDNTVANKSMFWIQGAGTDSDCVTASNSTGAFGASSITLESGTFTVDTTNGGVFYLTSGIKPVVKGGTFNVDPSTFLSNDAAAYYDVTNGAWVVTTPILAAKAVAARFGSEVYNNCGSNVADVVTPADYFISLSSKPAYVGETATEIDLSVGKNSHIKENDFAADGMKVAWPVVLFNATDDNDSAAITSTKVNGTTYTTLTDNGNNNYTVVQDYDHYKNHYIGFGIEGTSSNDVLVTRKVNTYSNHTVSTSYGVSTSDDPSTTGGQDFGIWIYWPGYDKTIQQVREMDGQTLDYSIHNTTNGKTAVVHLTFDCKPVPTPVAQIGTTEYTSLAEAVENAQSGAIITLLDDVTLTATVNIDKDLTINLAGHNITATNARALWVKSGNVNITGSGTISSTHTQENTTFADSSSVIRVGDANTNNAAAYLAIGSGVTVSSDYCIGVSVFGKNVPGITLAVEGTVSVTGDAYAISGNGSNGLSATTMTINSGAEVSSTQTYAIYHPGKGTLTVNGTVTGYGGIEAKGGTVIVDTAYGASVTATATAQSHSAYNNGASTSGYAIAAVNNTSYAGDPTVQILGNNANNISGQVVLLADFDADAIATVKSESNSIAVPTGYRWEDAGDNTYTLTIDNDSIDYTKPKWAWYSANGTMIAVVTYTSPSGVNKEQVRVTPTISENQGTRTYTATDHDNTATMEKTLNYTVSLNGTALSTNYKWGEVCTLKRDSNCDWYLGDSVANGKMIANGRNTYTFAVTQNVEICTEATGLTSQDPLSVVEITSPSARYAEFHARWSLPEGVRVTSVTIYRGYTHSSNLVSQNVLRTYGTPYNVDLKALNGDFLLKLNQLSTGVYQQAMIEIKYKYDGYDEEGTLTSEVVGVIVK